MEGKEVPAGPSWRSEEKPQPVWKRRMGDSSLLLSRGLDFSFTQSTKFLSSPSGGLTEHAIASLATQAAKITLFLWEHEF